MCDIDSKIISLKILFVFTSKIYFQNICQKTILKSSKITSKPIKFGEIKTLMVSHNFFWFTESNRWLEIISRMERNQNSTRVVPSIGVNSEALFLLKS